MPLPTSRRCRCWSRARRDSEARRRTVRGPCLRDLECRTAHLGLIPVRARRERPLPSNPLRVPRQPFRVPKRQFVRQTRTTAVADSDLLHRRMSSSKTDQSFPQKTATGSFGSRAPAHSLDRQTFDRHLMPGWYRSSMRPLCRFRHFVQTMGYVRSKLEPAVGRAISSMLKRQQVAAHRQPFAVAE